MTGIDSRLATVLASRIDSLIDSVAAGSRTAAAQTGASTQASDMSAAPATGAPLVDTPPPASAQATLSEVALTLDAISRLGGEATPAVLGEAPIWSAPPAIDAQSGTPGGLFAAAAAGAEETAAAGGQNSPAAQEGPAGQSASGAATSFASTASAASIASAASLPVAALASALASTVAETGLFYESHLAQWLSGGYPAAALLKEPQTRLAAQAVQLSLDWSGEDAGLASSNPQLVGWSGTTASGGLPGAAVPPHAAAAQLLASTLAAQARSDASMYAGARQLPGLPGQAGPPEGKLADAGQGTRAAQLADSAPASIAASIHPSTIPLVRQQLDLLATEQFRWSGEVWPGAKLDWTIEPDDPRRGRPGEPDTEDEQTWRTRLTLALPTLGTVDADLVLRGSQLIVRVQASAAGAARLATGGSAFGRRLEAAGIELAGLTIREIGGTAAGAASGAAQAATSAYARAAATAAEAQAHETADADKGTETASEATGGPRAAREAARVSPLDHLFDDPFDWSGA